MKKSKFLVLCLVLLVIVLSIGILAACDKDNDGNTSGKTPPDSGEKLLNGTFDGMVIENGILTKYSGSATELVVPNGVTSIGYDAFYGCSGLTSITIPNSVTSISFEAFKGCSNLTIYAEVEEEPQGWVSNWNPANRPVVWGHKG